MAGLLRESFLHPLPGEQRHKGLCGPLSQARASLHGEGGRREGGREEEEGEGGEGDGGEGRRGEGGGG